MRFSLLVFTLLFSACTSPSPHGEAKSHMQQNQQLAQLLNDLTNVVYERTFSELEKDELLIVYAKDFTLELDQLLVHLATEKVTLLHSQELKKKEPLYQSIRSLLQRNNSELKKVIQKNRPELILPLVKNSINLCNSCHNSFRKP